MSAYELRMYDEVLASFDVDKDAFGRIVVTDIDQRCEVRLLPMRMVQGMTPDSVTSWLESRVIPRNRRFVEKILSQAGLAPGDTLGIMNVCLGLSVNDAYWFVPAGFEGTWSEYNLYENDLDTALALVAYTGNSTGQRRGVGPSGEWTTDGQYPKAWRRIDGGLVLYKTGTSGYADSGSEPWSEWFASQVADAMGFPHVRYGLERWEGRLASTCTLMHGPETSFVPFWAACATGTFPEALACGLRVSDAQFEAMRDMYVFDALIANLDRHANNYGMLRDNESGLIVGPAPLFDQNLSLFAQDMEVDFPTWPDKAGSLYPAGSALTFDEVSRFVMDKRHHAMLRAVLGMTLEDNDACPVGDRRLDALNRYVHARARQLLAVEPRKSADVARDISGILPEDFVLPCQPCLPGPTFDMVSESVQGKARLASTASRRTGIKE